MMKWETVRENYPDKWLLIEAIEAHSENGKRIVSKLAVLNSYNESKEALGEYKELHCREPQRELYVAHSSKKSLDIYVKKDSSPQRETVYSLRVKLKFKNILSSI